MKVLISGASGDIGGEIARAFAARGDSVALLYNSNAERAQALATSLAKFGGMVVAEKADFLDVASVENALAKVKSAFGSVDVVVNCAGISYIGLAMDMSAEDWDKVFAVNARSAFLLSKWAIPLMQNGGRIINISSIWGSSPAPCESAYSASKGAVEAFTRSLAAEVGSMDITVNAIAAGLIDTKMNACFTAQEKQDFINELPIRRAGTPQDVANAVLFLASDSASYITGEVLHVSGGK